MTYPHLRRYLPRLPAVAVAAALLLPAILPAPAAAQTTSLGLRSTQSPDKMVGVPYWQVNSGYGGQPPYTFSVDTSATSRLPRGTQVDPATGTVSGTPTEAVSFKYMVRIQDAGGASAHREVQGTVSPNPGVVAVQPTDVLYNLSAADPESYKYPTLQCQGDNHYFWNWGSYSGHYVQPPPNPLYGTDPALGTFTAFSIAPPQQAEEKPSFQWDVRKTDPDTSGQGAKRCEFSLGWRIMSYPGKVQVDRMGLKANETYWWAVAVKAEDWSSTVRNNENDWQILWQWHDFGGPGLPPYLALHAKGNRWFMQLAYDTNATPSNSTLKKLWPWQAEMRPGTWNRFIVKARKDLTTRENSFVQVWLNGTLIVDYHGPLGYNLPDADYPKVGLYKWFSVSPTTTPNVWHDSQPARRMWSKGPVQVKDRAGYSWVSIDPLLDR